MKKSTRQRRNAFRIYRHCVAVSVLCIIVTTPLYATDYYVSGSGNDANTGLSPSAAFSTLQRAADLTNPGDVVYIMNGIYDQVQPLYGNQRTVLYITRSGLPGQPITYRNYPGHTPKISGVNCTWNCVLILANYIRFEGVEVEGRNGQITYEEARAMYDYYEANKPNVDWNLIGTMNVNGISIGEPKVTFVTHHVAVVNCRVHDFQNGGIATSQVDYITIENNVAYNNAWYGMYASSGISLFHSRDIDSNTDVKNLIRNNVTYHNKTLVPWADTGGRMSDGNGIIIDDNKNTQRTGVSSYRGKTLVENNLSYYNGGSGMHAYSCAYVTFRNNTAYNNGQVVGYPEISAGSSNDCFLINNIMYARDGGFCNGDNGNRKVTYDYNVYYGPVATSGSNDIFADPQFNLPSIDPAVADFRVQLTSPAIDAGTANYGVGSTDLDGFERIQGGGIDIGAYESGSVPCTVPAAPTNLVAVAVSASQINLEWTDNAGDEQGFQIDRKTGAGSWEMVATAAANVTTAEITGLQAETTYFFRVRAQNGNCTSPFSNETSATTAAAGPSVHIEAENFDGTYRIRHSGTFISNVNSGGYVYYQNVDLGEGYGYLVASVAKGSNVGETDNRRLEIRLGSVTGELIGTLYTEGTGSWSTFSEQQTPLGVNAGVQTIYLVGEGGRGIGNIDWIRFTNDASAAAQVTGISSSTLDAVDTSVETSIYPMPVSGTLVVEYHADASGSLAITLVDGSGNPVLQEERVVSEGHNTLHLDLAGQKSDLYLLNLTHGSKRETRRVIVD